MPPSDLEGFARLIEAVRPWHDDLMIIGGWAHRLYQYHERATLPAHLVIQTRDADLALAAREVHGDIGAALRAAGFKETLSGDHDPPVSEYRFGDEEDGFFAEFLVPLTGSGLRRDGSPDATVTRAGVTAQKLKYLDILFVRPWRIELTRDHGMPLSKASDVLVPNPACFIAQKLLIQRQRPAEKQAQDTLYIHDTIELFAAALADLNTEWKGIAPQLGPLVVRRVGAEIVTRFSRVTDVIRGAARIPLDRKLVPDVILRVCRTGLDRIFGA